MSEDLLVGVFGGPDKIPTLKELAKAWSPDGDFHFVSAFKTGINTIQISGYPRPVPSATNPSPEVWSIGYVQRSFERTKKALVVHHDYQVLKHARTDRNDETKPPQGMGTRAVRNSMALYSHLRADAIEAHAAWSGKFAWPHMGFDWMPGKKPPDLEQNLARFLAKHGVEEPLATAASAVERPWMITEITNGTIHTRANRAQGGTIDLTIGKLFMFEEASPDLLFVQLNLKDANSESFKHASRVVLQPRKPK